MDQQEANKKMNQIMMNLITKLFTGMTENNNQTLSAILQFDEVQRISEISNPIVDGQVVTPNMNLITDLNEVAKELNTLPEIYKLKSLEVQVGAGGQVSMKPEYLTN